MNNSQLTSTDFPLIWVNDQESSIGAFRTMEELTTCSRGVVKPRGFYQDLKLFSITGKEFVVRSAKILNTLRPITLENFLWRLVNADLVSVDLEIDSVTNTNTDDLKSGLISIINRKPDRWDSDGNLDKLLQLLHMARSKEELVQIMSKRYFSGLF